MKGIMKHHSKSLEHVVVLMGGFSAEREISLMSGNGVLQALQAQGIKATAFDPSKQCISELNAKNFSHAFINLHGRYGEDGIMQSILEHAKLPYTGSGVLASSIAMNKEMTKRIWQSYGISTPKFYMLNPGFDAQDVVKTLGLPLIVKPAREGSSIGLTKVDSIEQLQNAYEKAFSLDGLVMAEQYIKGPEITCAIIEIDGKATALPLIEIKAPNANYDYHNKYFTDDVQYFCPAPIDHLQANLSESIQAVAVKAFEVLNCRGWARIDIMIDAQTNLPYLLEINTSPGMTSHSLVPMAAKAFGLSYEALVKHVALFANLDYSL